MYRLHTPLFHITHAVEDLDGALDCYRRLFRAPVLDGGYWDVPRRSAIFTFVGGVWLEAMAPDPRGGGLRVFVDRFGGRFHSLAWYVDGIDEIAENLRQANVRFFDSDGDLIGEAVPRHGPMPLTPGYRHEYPAGWESAVLYTNFRDSHGMIELCQPSADHPLPPRHPDPDMIPVDNPLGVLRTSHQTIVVNDCREAAEFYVTTLGGRLVGERDDDALAARSTFVVVGDGEGTVLEFAQPVADGVAMADLTAFGRPILHRSTYQVSDLAKVRDHLASEQFDVELDVPGLIVTAPASTVGARFGFTDRAIPTA